MKKVIRYCDCCNEEITNPYHVGVVTMYGHLRIGGGGYFDDYDKRSIRKYVNEELPNDTDLYSKGYGGSDEDKEFIFCSLEHCFQFQLNLYTRTMKKIETKKNEFMIGRGDDKLAKKNLSESQSIFTRFVNAIRGN